jgi:hypothetical protein
MMCVRGARAVIDEDRSQQTRAMPRGLHDVVDEICRGGLAVCAGHSGDRHAAPGITGQGGGQECKRVTAIGHVEPQHRRIELGRRRGFRKNGGCSGIERVLDEPMPIGPGATHRGEELARTGFLRGIHQG